MQLVVASSGELSRLFWLLFIINNVVIVLGILMCPDPHPNLITIMPTPNPFLNHC